jgi:hypothetical protein
MASGGFARLRGALSDATGAVSTSAGVEAEGMAEGMAED